MITTITKDTKLSELCCNDEDELAHYGVPGMKWGVRRAEEITKGNTKKAKKLQARAEEITKGNTKKAKKLQARAEKLRQRLFGLKFDDLTANSKNIIDTGSSAALHTMLHQQMAQEHIRIAIQDSNRVASLGITGGMNPFMFG